MRGWQAGDKTGARERRDRSDFLPTRIPGFRGGKVIPYLKLLPCNFDLQNLLFKKPDAVVHTCNPSTGEVQTGRSLRLADQISQHNLVVGS